ncbi:MAG: 16S rRNA (guanine(966)-N(2))-methyltransferase RsmD [Paracoccaceae bacterium]|nr:16S rRNA (guanine(966)-N(2))-methyltransferase RsmD [Paracoccaceae bacterium]
MRIIGGRYRGLRLASVGKGDAAAHLRPTTDRVRESIFNLLVNGSQGDVIAGARVLDVFAGTGALGLEALSRGATSVLFMDTGRKALALIAQNIALCRADEVAQALRRDATRPGRNEDAPFDLLFLDPPYGKGLGEKALVALALGGWLCDGAQVVWEEAARQQPPTGFTLLDTRRYGDTWVHLLRFDAV